MADYMWIAGSPLQEVAAPGRRGTIVEQPGVLISEIPNFSLVLILARRGRRVAAAKAAKTLFGVEPPTMPQMLKGSKATLIWSGADQFYALFAKEKGSSPLDGLREGFAGTASLSDQSDGRALIQISGTGACRALAKVSSLDLDDEVFPIGSAAATSIDHTGVNLWRDADTSDGSPVFNVLVFSSFAHSTWMTIMDSAAEYGAEIGSPHKL